MKSFDRLFDIIQTLRSENGCSWDKAQTLNTLTKPFLEECYEMIDAVEYGDKNDIKEEFGDVFFMNLLMGYIAQQEGICSIEDILNAASEKLIYRHPHIFSNVEAKTQEEIIANWERLKKEEKPERTSIFDGIPVSLPGVMKFEKICKKLQTHNYSLEEYLVLEDSQKAKLRNMLLSFAMEQENITKLLDEINKDIETEARKKEI